jgi:tripartite-type tricarboxylate transporter receptor subunit TctC
MSRRLFGQRLTIAALLSLGLQLSAQASGGPLQIVILGKPGSHADIVGRVVATQLMADHQVQIVNASSESSVPATAGTLQLRLTGSRQASQDETTVWQLSGVPDIAKGGLPAPAASSYRLALGSILSVEQQQQLRQLLKQRLDTARVQQQWQVYGLQRDNDSTLTAGLH